MKATSQVVQAKRVQQAPDISRNTQASEQPLPTTNTVSSERSSRAREAELKESTALLREALPANLLAAAICRCGSLTRARLSACLSACPSVLPLSLSLWPISLSVRCRRQSAPLSANFSLQEATDGQNHERAATTTPPSPEQYCAPNKSNALY